MIFTAYVIYQNIKRTKELICQLDQTHFGPHKKDLDQPKPFDQLTDHPFFSFIDKLQKGSAYFVSLTVGISAASKLV